MTNFVHNRRRWVEYLWLGIILLAFATIRYVRKDEPLGLDQGLFGYFGEQIPNGALPYRDIWDSKPPGIFYLYAAAFQILGSSPESVNLLDSLWTALTGIALYLIVRRRYNVQAAIAATLTYAIFSSAPQFGGFWATAQAEVFIALPLLFAWYLVSSPPSTHDGLRPFTIGLLLGAAILFKIAALLFVPFFAGAILVLSVREEKVRKRPLIATTARRLLTFAIGGLILPAIAIAYFSHRGVLNQMIEAMTSYQTHYLEAVIQGRDLVRITSFQFSKFVRDNLTVTVLSTIGCIHILWKGRSAPSILLVLWYIVAISAVCMQRQFAGYHFILILIPASILAGYGFLTIALETKKGQTSPPREPRPSPMEPPNHLATNKSQSSPLRVAPFPLVLLLRMAPFLLLPLIILDARGYSSFYATDIEFQRGRIGYDEYVQVFNRGAVSFDNDRRVAEYLKSHTSPDDPILVWGLAPSIYYLSGRPSSTRYVFHHVLLTSSPFSVRYPGLEERQEAFMAELDRRPPKIIVIGTNDRNGFEPEDSYTQMLAFPRFKDYVFENYRPETKIGRFLIARRID